MNRTYTDPRHRQSDEELAGRAALGDEPAFGELYRRLRPASLAVATQICGRSAAEDAVQAGFLAAWRSLARYEPSRGTVKSWLLSIVRNRSIDLLRAQGRRALQPFEAEFELEDPVRTDDVVAQHELTRDVTRALCRLPDDQREVLELAYFGELSQTEIADTLSVPLGTVKGRARLGLKKLPRDLAHHAETPALAAA